MRANMLGVGIDNITGSEAMTLVARRIRQKQNTVVYTPNPTMMYQAMKDSDFRRTLNRAHLNLPDGVGLRIAAALLSLPLSHRVAGIEFGESLLAFAARTGLRVFLLGGKTGVATAAAQKLRQKHPTLTVCGVHHGYFAESESQAICDRIERVRADILLVCLGSPRQEKWIAKHHPRGVLVSAALGGSLDVWAGNVTRAPHVLSAMGLEWLWRICLEPNRLAKLPHILAFLCTAAAEGAKTQLLRGKL